MKRLLKTRVRGTIGDFVTALLGITVITLVTLWGVFSVGDMATKQRLDDICRKYALQIETDGNMTADEIAAKELQVSNEIISRLGDTVRDDTIMVTIVSNTYGNRVSITVECDVRLRQNRFRDLFNVVDYDQVGYTRYVNTIDSTSKS